jgi:hypothetical protein
VSEKALARNLLGEPLAVGAKSLERQCAHA